MKDFETLQAELRAVDERLERIHIDHARRCEQFSTNRRSLKKRGSALQAACHRLILVHLLDQPDAVRLRDPYPESSPCHRLNNQPGKLVEVTRKTCRVDFGGKVWRFPIDRVVPAVGNLVPAATTAASGNSQA